MPCCWNKKVKTKHILFESFCLSQGLFCSKSKSRKSTLTPIFHGLAQLDLAVLKPCLRENLVKILGIFFSLQFGDKWRGDVALDIIWSTGDKIKSSQTFSKAGQSMSRKKKCSFTLWAPFAPRRLSGSWKPQFTIISKSLFCLCQKPAHSLSRFSGQLLKPEDRWLGDKIFWKPFQAGMWLLSLLYLCRADLSSFLGNGKVHSLSACCRAQFQEPTYR